MTLATVAKVFPTSGHGTKSSSLMNDWSWWQKGFFPENDFGLSEATVAKVFPTSGRDTKISSP